MKFRTCNICKETKDEEANFYYRKGRKHYENTCKICSIKKAKEHYENNKERHIEQSRVNLKRRLKERREFVYIYLLNHPCINCGVSDPRVLDFDHIEPGEKDLPISRAIYHNWSMERLIKEIEKCQVLCANCHRRRTAQQFNWYSDMPDENKD